MKQWKKHLGGQATSQGAQAVGRDCGPSAKEKGFRDGEGWALLLLYVI